ncbi:hypothetical protein VTK56DRAFT_1250 [Thermocarpiscus australiensis]
MVPNDYYAYEFKLPRLTLQSTKKYRLVTRERRRLTADGPGHHWRGQTQTIPSPLAWPSFEPGHLRRVAGYGPYDQEVVSLLSSPQPSPRVVRRAEAEGDAPQPSTPVNPCSSPGARPRGSPSSASPTRTRKRPATVDFTGPSPPKQPRTPSRGAGPAGSQPALGTPAPPPTTGRPSHAAAADASHRAATPGPSRPSHSHQQASAATASPAPPPGSNPQTAATAAAATINDDDNRASARATTVSSSSSSSATGSGSGSGSGFRPAAQPGATTTAPVPVPGNAGAAGGSGGGGGGPYYHYKTASRSLLSRLRVERLRAWCRDLDLVGGDDNDRDYDQWTKADCAEALRRAGVELLMKRTGHGRGGGGAVVVREAEARAAGLASARVPVGLAG